MSLSMIDAIASVATITLCIVSPITLILMVSEIILATRSSHSTAEWWVRFLYGISIIIVLVSAICAVSFAGYAQNSRQQLTVQAAKPLNSLTVEYGKTRKLHDLMQRYAKLEAQNRQQADARYQWEEFERDNGIRLEFSLNELRLNAWTNVTDEHVNITRVGDTDLRKWLVDQSARLQKMTRLWEQHP